MHHTSISTRPWSFLIFSSNLRECLRKLYNRTTQSHWCNKMKIPWRYKKADWGSKKLLLYILKSQHSRSHSDSSCCSFSKKKGRRRSKMACLFFIRKPTMTRNIPGWRSGPSRKSFQKRFAAPRASLGSKCPSCSTFLTAAYIARLPSRCCMPTSEHAQLAKLVTGNSWWNWYMF